MKIQEIRKKTIVELEKDVQDLRKKLNDMMFKASSNQVKNVKEIGNIKKQIARSLTIINESK